MNRENELMINVLRSNMKTMTDGERVELMNALMADYCHECGSEYLPCYCALYD